MLGQLPPWISVSPRDFVLATQAGAQLGHTIADSTQRAFEEQQRMQMEEKRQEQAQAQQAIQNAAQRLAAERLEQYRQSEIANRQAQLGIETKRLGALDIQQQRADDAARRSDEIARHNQALELAKANQRKLLSAGGRLWDVTDPEQGAIPVTPAPFRNPPKDPVQSALLGVDAADLRNTEKQIQQREANKPSGLGRLLHPGYQDDTDKLKATAEAMRKEIQSKYGSNKRLRYDPATGDFTPAGGTSEADSE